MTRRRGEAGDGKLGCILWTLLLAIVVLGAWKWVPAKVKSAELHDFMVEQAKWAGSEKAETLRGRIVAKAAEQGVALHRLPLAVMRGIEPRMAEDVFSVLSVDRSVKSRVSYGGTAPKNVRAQAKKWLRKLEKSKS